MRAPRNRSHRYVHPISTSSYSVRMERFRTHGTIVHAWNEHICGDLNAWKPSAWKPSVGVFVCLIVLSFSEYFCTREGGGVPHCVSVCTHRVLVLLSPVLLLIFRSLFL